MTPKPQPALPHGLSAVLQQVSEDPGARLRAYHALVTALDCQAVHARFERIPALEHFLLLPSSLRTALVLHLNACESCGARYGERVDPDHLREPVLPELSDEEQDLLAAAIRAHRSGAAFPQTQRATPGSQRIAAMASPKLPREIVEAMSGDDWPDLDDDDF
jgi:hypothetical protein